MSANDDIHSASLTFEHTKTLTRWGRVVPLSMVLVTLSFAPTFDFDYGASGAKAESLDDPLDVIAQRSPGERGEGALASTKRVIGPHERVLAEVRERSPLSGAGPDSGMPSFAVPPGFSTGAATPGEIAGGANPDNLSNIANTAFDSAAPADETIGTAPAANADTGGSAPGSNSNDPPSGGFDNPGRTVSPPGGSGGSAPVPEPTTWLLLISGFFGVGAARRFGRNRTAA